MEKWQLIRAMYLLLADLHDEAHPGKQRRALAAAEPIATWWETTGKHIAARNAARRR